MARRVIATAAVQVEADTSGVERQLRNIIDPVKDIGGVFRRETDRWVEDMRRASDEMEEVFRRALSDMSGDAERTGERVEDSFEEAARQSGHWFEQYLGESGMFSDLILVAGRAGESVEDSMREAAISSDDYFQRYFGANTFNDLTTAAERAGERVEGSFREAARQSERHLRGISLGKLGLAGLGAVLANAAVEVTRFGLTVTDQLETARARFGGLTESAEEADAMMRTMVEYAVNTPFDLPGVSNAAAQLVAVGDGFGVTTENVTEYLDIIGNAAAATGGTGEEMTRLVRVFGQMSSSGKVLGQDMNQLAQNIPGLDVWQALADGTGKSVEELRKLQDLGTLDELLTGNEAVQILLEAMTGIPGAGRDWEALAAATGKTVEQLQNMPTEEVAALAEEFEVGMTAMERKMTTWGGVMEKFQDTVGLALNDGLKPFVKSLKESMTDPAVLDGITALANEFGNLLSSITNQLGPFMPQIIGVFAELMSIVGDLTPILEPLAIAFAAIGRAAAPIARAFAEFVGRAAKPLAKAFDALTPILEEVGSILSTLLATALSAIEPLLGALLDLVVALAPILPPIARAFLSIVAALTPLISVLAQVISSFVGPFGELIEALGPLLESVGLMIANVLVGAIEHLTPLLISLGPLFQSIVDVLVALMPILPPLVELLFLFAFQGLQAIITFLPIVLPLVQALTVLLEALAVGITFVAEPIAGVLQAIVDFVNRAQELFMQFVTAVIEPIANFVNGVIEWFQKLFDELVGHSIIPDLVNAIIYWFTFLWNIIETIVTTIWNVITTIWNTIKDTVLAIVGGIVDWLRDAWTRAKDTIVDIWNAVKNRASEIWNGVRDKIKEIVGGIRDWLKNTWDGIKTTASELWDGIKSTITGAVQSASDTISGIIDGIVGFFADLPGRILSGLGNIASQIADALTPDLPGPLGTVISKITPWADGGIATAPHLGLVAEAGPEAMVPLRNPGRALEILNQAGLDRLVLAQQRGVSSGGGVNFYGGQIFEDATDADLVAQRILVAQMAVL